MNSMNHFNFSCVVIDGAVIVHCLPTASINTFDNYANILYKQLQKNTRVVVVYVQGLRKRSDRSGNCLTTFIRSN